MPKATKTKPAKVLRGGTEPQGREVVKPRQLSEAEQRTITFKPAIDSACSGQWVQQIIHERLDNYPPAGMRLGDARVLTPPWNAVETEHANSGGVNGTRRWAPRNIRELDTLEDKIDLLRVGECWQMKEWPSAIRYDLAHAGRDASVWGPRPRRHAVSAIRVTRFVRLGDWPAHAVPEEPIIICGVE
jgi:hypothetical protein